MSAGELPPVEHSDTGEALKLLADIAIEAGSEILAIYHRGAAVAEKADGSPVTEADHASERVILSALSIHFPSIPVISEEQVEAGNVPAVGSKAFLVDPLDGTREFINRNGEFTINIALIEDGAPVLGIVHAPALGRLFAGAAGVGAKEYHVTNGRANSGRPIKVRGPEKDDLVAVVSRSHRTKATDVLLKDLGVTSFKTAGSALKFGLLAAGEADIYPRVGRTMMWDTAAGDAVLRAAGGMVVNMDGQPMRYDASSDRANRDLSKPEFHRIISTCDLSKSRKLYNDLLGRVFLHRSQSHHCKTSKGNPVSPNLIFLAFN